MGCMGSVFDYLWQRNSNQGSSLQQKWRFVSRRTNRDQRLPCGWVSRFSLLQYYLLWFYIIPGPPNATPTPSVPPTAHPTTPLTSPPTPTPTPSHILRMISFFGWSDLQFPIHLSLSSVNGFKGCGSVDNGTFLIYRWQLHCSMRLSIALRIWNIWKCKGLVFAQFSSNIH